LMWVHSRIASTFIRFLLLLSWSLHNCKWQLEPWSLFLFHCHNLSHFFTHFDILIFSLMTNWIDLICSMVQELTSYPPCQILYCKQDPGTEPAIRLWPSIDVGTEIFNDANFQAAEWTVSDFDILIPYWVSITKWCQWFMVLPLEMGRHQKLPAPLRGIQHPIILFLDCCNILAKQRIVPATKET
jgi:hypothetical protein